MSGGSMEYLYSRVQTAHFAEDTPLRKAFRRHLILVAEALHDIEWVDSGDYGPGDEDAAIRACLAPGVELAAATQDARDALAALPKRRRKSSYRTMPLPRRLDGYWSDAQVLALLADTFGDETSAIDLAEALKCPLPVACAIMSAAMACAMGEVHPHDEDA